MKPKQNAIKNFKKNNISKIDYRNILSLLTIFIMFFVGSLPANAHCDSYDGPVIQDAQKALERNNVSLVLKWISEEQEPQIVDLFNKTYNLKNKDEEVYGIVKKHFFETLVRLHRETEGAPFTGLKPAGETKQVIELSDHALANKDVDDLIEKFNAHLGKVIRKKYSVVAGLDKVKNESVERGREYVRAYVDYTHTLEAIHDLMEHDRVAPSHNHE
ncbi:DUF6448 family protein [Christiangramia crocea]|uniref:DUF6448 family protein n=1 Tax=Christiangramia crocea TaxID=2904124 RepID=A0A9X2A6V9_9FLAO|nr:DUF6448 family protein [Gramella crocea]MCG9970907.1 DUF6448 family protein [Gramella crocea]